MGFSLFVFDKTNNPLFHLVIKFLVTKKKKKRKRGNHSVHLRHLVLIFSSLLTVRRAGLTASMGDSRTSELMLRSPSSPQGDQTVDSTPKVSVLR